MSGIVALIHRNGAPVDSHLLEEMTRHLAPRGADAQRTWIGGPVGLGHTLLKTADAATERQPYSADGHVWITADARIDARADLSTTLKARTPYDLNAESDAGLILHAYLAWGDACLDHLLGDFCFVIWDGRRRRILCGRDHFGVKPLFYAEVPDGLVVSNTLSCLRLHPAVCSGLNEQAIGDFLLVGSNEDPATTYFAAIRSVPPAHCLACWGPRPVRYWSVPLDGAVRYKRGGDYVEHFQDILRSAVSDRVRGSRASVFMSGGLDSTSVAAIARECSADVHAFTTIAEGLIPDDERHYAALAASALGIPIRFRALDGYRPFAHWDLTAPADLPAPAPPEPEVEPLRAVFLDQLRDAACHSRIVLTGCGGDPAFRVTVGYPIGLLRSRKLGQLAGEIWQYAAAHRRLPRVRLLHHLKSRLAPQRPSPAFPGWLDPDFAKRQDLHARWEWLQREPTAIHATRPDAYACLVASDWQQLFESYDFGATSVAAELRHPLFDVRLVSYLLTVPPLPWCTNKSLMRLAMRGRLPETVRRRPKTVLAQDPVVELLRNEEMRWVDRFEAVPELSRYVVRDRIPVVCGENDSATLWTSLRPLCLNAWLTRQCSDRALATS